MIIGVEAVGCSLRSRSESSSELELDSESEHEYSDLLSLYWENIRFLKELSMLSSVSWACSLLRQMRRGVVVECCCIFIS